SHVFERTINYTYLATGASIYFADGLESIAENLQDIKPQYFTTVPRLLERVFEKIIKKSKELNYIKKSLFDWALDLATNLELGQERSFVEEIELNIANQLVFDKWRLALGGNIKAIVCGSAPLQPKLATIFTNAQIPILEGYGLTECSPVVSVIPNRADCYRAGCVGKILPHLEVKIADDGEILVRGDSVMKGYFNDDAATKKTITTDGWLLTGDIGAFTEDGYLRITDRKKELFKTSGGKYVAPAPIENKMKESFFIEQIALIGDGEKFIGALIVPNFEELSSWASTHNIKTEDNTQLIENPKVVALYQSIISENNVNFGKVEQIKQFKLLNEAWTVENGLLTATMKLKRKKIKEAYQDIIQSIYNK
ncbi:MAG: long-chain fatty acid--CoA ligase, partial [Chitinophagales bacterium]|nr:long-chain fatty acid--CoA ligase [Chitinophagales bacterium]